MSSQSAYREPVSPRAVCLIAGFGVFFAWILAGLVLRPEATRSPGPDDWMDVVVLLWLAGCLLAAAGYAAADGYRKLRHWSQRGHEGWYLNR